MLPTIARSSRGAGTWQNDGNPCSYCGHSPCTTKENGRPPHCWSGARSGARSCAASQKDGDQDSAST